MIQGDTDLRGGQFVDVTLAKITIHGNLTKYIAA